jgi:hypothetical protein
MNPSNMITGIFFVLKIYVFGHGNAQKPKLIGH